MKSIAIFAGSNFGSEPDHKASTLLLAKEIVSHGCQLVYGGGAVGLMGVIADEVLRLGGKVIGVLPEQLAGAEIAHKNLTQLHIVKTMHERKALMAELSDAFIAIPGGIGTLEEIIEVFTWTQLGFHQKPCGLLNSKGFYDKLYGFLNSMRTSGFLSDHHLKTLLIEEEAADLLHKLSHQQLVYQPKWTR